MKKSFLSAFALLILLSTASCKTAKKIADTQQEATPAEASAQKGLALAREDMEGTWIVKTAEGKTVVGDSPVEITFDLAGGRIYGNDGCNVINGSVILEGDNLLRFESLISTMKACRPEVTDRAVLNALNNTRSYTCTDAHKQSIEFCDSKGKTVMTLEKRMVDQLNGSWKVISIDGKEITAENPTMVIDIPEGKLSGFAGCNRMFGNIVLDGTPYGITFTQVGATRMACPDMATEQAFLSMLEKITTFQPIDNNRAALCMQPSVPAIVLEKVQ